MSIQDHEIQRLFKSYVQGTISKDEMDEMLLYFQKHGFPDEVDQAMLQELKKAPHTESHGGPANHTTGDIRHVTDRVEARLLENLKDQRIPVMRRWVSRVAAAAVLVFMMGALWYTTRIYSTNNAELAAGPVSETTTFSPAGNRASLVLSDGRIITLDESQEGILIEGQRISYQDGSSTVLDLDDQSTVESITLTTPRGGTYRLTLPDGTQVWLNAASTLTYPSRFSQEERVVHLEGEAYFAVRQIEKDKKLLPFRVESLKQTIEVLGTEFNVSAYADEAETRTTLVEGKVSVQQAGRGESLMLVPGEQSLVGQQAISKARVNVRDYTDWKNGEFVFRNENTHQVMQRIGRWYDLDLGHLDRQAVNERFSGTISRYGDLQTVLDIMAEAADLSFEVEDRTVSVFKKK